jgi:hypothetical protein
MERGFVDQLEPGVVLDFGVGFAVPFRERLALLIELSSSFKERTSSKYDLPA